MSDFPMLPLWTDAFLADTGHLSAEETGSYLLLLMAAWRSPACELPDDDVCLARWARCSVKRWRAMKPRILAFWSLNEAGNWTQKRLGKERLRCSRRAEVNRENGCKGGRPKPLKNMGASNPMGSVSLTQKETIHNHNHNNPSIPVETGTKSSAPDEAFLTFKEAYPKRDGAQDWAKAKDRFRRHVAKGIEASDLVAAARAYRDEVERKGSLGTPYVKQAATFLTTVWKDYLTVAQPTARAPCLPAGWPSYFPPPDVVKRAWASGLWAEAWGPRPGEPGCLVSPNFLSELVDAGGPQ